MQEVNEEYFLSEEFLLSKVEVTQADIQYRGMVFTSRMLCSLFEAITGHSVKEAENVAEFLSDEKMAQIKAEADAKKAAKQEEVQEAPPPPAPGEPPAPPIPRQQPAASPTPAPSGGGGGDTIYLTIQKMDVFPSDVAGFIKQLEEQARRQ
jgi:hypothetical protein